MAVPQTGQGCRYFPCAAISGRKAVTFSGNFPAACALSSSIQSFNTVCVDLNSRADSSASSLCVSCTGERRAWMQNLVAERIFQFPKKSPRIGERAA